MNNYFCVLPNGTLTQTLFWKYPVTAKIENRVIEIALLPQPSTVCCNPGGSYK